MVLAFDWTYIFQCLAIVDTIKGTSQSELDG